MSDATGNRPRDFSFFYADGYLQATWDADSVPDGYQVVLEFLDAQGQELTLQPSVQYTTGHATVTVANSQPGQPFWVRARVVSPYTPTAHVILHEVGVVSSLAVDWRQGQLHATWTAPQEAGVYAYHVKLLDQDRNPVTQQPAITVEGDTGAAIAGDTLVDGNTYIVSVQAEQDGSLGAVTYAPPYELNKNLPDSLVLRTLLERLSATIASGQGTCSLSPQVVQAANITDLFADLLGQDDESLALVQASVTSSPDSVTVTGTASYPFATEKVSTFVFTDVAGVLQLMLTANDLGTFTVQELIENEIIPDSNYDLAEWSEGLTALPNLNMQLHSQEAVLRFSGAPTAIPWSIPIGLANVAIGAVQPAMEIRVAEEGWLDYNPWVSTNLRLGADLQIPIRIAMPAGMEGWMFSLDAPEGVSIGDLAHFNPLMGGANSSLPAGVIDLGGFRLTLLQFGFTPEPTPSVWHLTAGFAVGPSADAEWSALDGLIQLKGISAMVDIMLMNDGESIRTSTRGSVAGTLVIHDQLTISAGLTVPAVNGAWLLSGSAMLDSFQWADLARYLGGSAQPVTDVLSRLGTVGSVGLSRIQLLFKPDGENAGLHQLGADFVLSSWTVPELPWFSIDQLSLSLDVEQPTSANRVISGQVEGQLTLGNVQVGVNVDFSQADVWTLQLVSRAGLLSGLDQIRDVLPTDTILSFLPSGLGTDTTYGLGDFTMTYNTGEDYIAAATFRLNANIGWSWLNDLFTLWSIELDLQAARESKQDPLALTGSIGGTVGLAGAKFGLTAEKPEADAPWTFSGDLKESYYLDFNEVLRALHIDLQIPSGYGLPTAISFDQASLSVVPSTGQLDFNGFAGLKWSYDFGNSQLSIDSLGGELHKPGGEGVTTGAVNGTFSIGALHGYVYLALGNGVFDTVLEVDLALQEQARTDTLVDEVIGAGTFGGVSVPSSFISPHMLAEASLMVNLTQSKLLLTGQYVSTAPNALYGAGALLVANTAAEGQPAKWGFVLAAALGNWTLASISPVLSGLDEIIGLNKAEAAVALSLLDATVADEIHAKVPAIPAELSIAPGLSFYVGLDFNGGLLRNVRSMLDVQGAFTLSGHIPSDSTMPITLQASLESLTLLNTLSFENILLKYLKTPADQPGSQLTLTGGIVVSLDQPYKFQGDLHVTDTAAHFKVATTHSVANPLQIPGITLDGLGFEVDCAFVEGSLSSSQTMFFGQVTFTGGPTLRGLVGVQNGNAALVIIQLVAADGQPSALSISSLLKQATGLTWPDALDVSLSNGQLWYVPGTTPLTYQDKTYAPGFHASAQIKILFLPTVVLDVAVYSADTEMRKKGLVASAQFAQPIDWKFIKFTGTSTHGGKTMGPWVEVDTVNTALPFGLGSCIELFGTEIGDVEVRVGQEKMSGSFTLPDSAGLFAGSSMSFTWDKDGFHVDHWPLKGLDLPKFDLENIKGTGGCAQVIAELLPIDTQFDLDVALSIAPPSGETPAQLSITLNGSFDLVVEAAAYESDPVLSVPIVNVTLNIPFPTTGGYDWDLLKDNIVEAIQDAGESLINNLLTGPDAPKNWAKLTAIAGIKWGIAEAIDYLVCRGMPRAAAQAAAGAAASGTAGAFTGWTGAVVAVGGVLATIVGGVVVIGAVHPDPAKPKPDTPAQPSLSFDTDLLTIAWPSAAHADKYAISLVGADGDSVPISSTSATTVIVSADQLTMGQSYSAKITAYGEGGRSDDSTAGSLYLVAPPAGLTLSYAEPILTATWQPVIGSQSYQVQVCNSAGALLQPQPDIHIEGTMATITGSMLEFGGTFEVQVRALAEQDLGPWAGASLLIEVLPAPDGLTVQTVGPNLSATWQAVVGATGYTVQVLGAADQPLQPEPVIQIDGTTAVISGNGIIDGAPLKVRVKGIAPNAVGTYGASVELIVNVIATPEQLQLCYQTATRTLIATWQLDAQATAYAVQVLDSSGQPLTPQPPMIVQGALAEIVLTDVSNASYGVCVQALATGAESLWCAPAWVTLIDLTAPSGVALTYAGNAINAQWNGVAGAQSYALIVFDAANVPLSPQPTVTYAGTTATVDASALTAGEEYRVQVQALAPSVVGPFGDPVAITIPRPVQTVLSLPLPGSGVAIPSQPAYSFAGTGDCTLEVSVRGTVGGTLLDHQDPSGRNRAGWNLSVSPQGLIVLTTSDVGGNSVVYPNLEDTPVLDGNWHSITALRRTVNGVCSFALYLDGRPLRAFPQAQPPLDITLDLPLYIGAPAIGNASSGWLGDVKQVRLWNVALSDAEIAAHQTTPPDPSDPRLVGYWPLTDRTADDLSQSRNNGTLQGHAAFVDVTE